MGIADSPSDIEESKHTHGTDQRQGIYTYGEVLVRQARDDPGAVERRGPRGALHTRHRLVRHGFPPSFFVLRAPLTNLMNSLYS